MLVCDCCHSTDQKKRKAFEILLITIKDEEKNKKIIPREMVRIPMHLCDKCIDHFHSSLGNLITRMRNDPPCEADRSKDIAAEYSNIKGFQPIATVSQEEQVQDPNKF